MNYDKDGKNVAAVSNRPAESGLADEIRRRGVLRWFYDFLSGFHLATFLLLLVGVLTWLATLEQVDRGLYPTLNKYFNWKSFFVLPEIKGKLVPLPLLGGYWACVLLLINLTLGGIVRIRKGWRNVGNIIAHGGIIFLLVAGGVAHHFSERGNMAIHEGEICDVAESYLEFTVEVAEIVDGKPAKIRVIRGDDLTDLREKVRAFRFPGLDFGLEISGYMENSVPVGMTERVPSGERVVDGYYLMERAPATKSEENMAGCYARVVEADGSKSQPFILAGASFHPMTLRRGDGRVFTVDMRKRQWPMPFAVRLDAFRAVFYPGTMKPEKYESDVTRIEGDSEATAFIRMNEPMRYEGLTFFQSSYGPPGAMPGQKMYSVFEIVRNPADKWPEYSLYVVAFGMLITFLGHLFRYLAQTFRRKP